MAEAPALTNVPPGYAVASIGPGTPARTTYQGPDGALLIVQQEPDPPSGTFDAYELLRGFDVAGRPGRLYAQGADLVVTWTNGSGTRTSIFAFGFSGRETFDRGALIRLAQEQEGPRTTRRAGPSSGSTTRSRPPTGPPTRAQVAPGPTSTAARRAVMQ